MIRNTLFIALASVFLLASCEYKSKGRLKKETFEIQQLAFNKVIQAYKDMNAYSFIDEIEDARLKIIFSATDSTFKSYKMYRKIEGTDEMIKHFKLLKRATIAFNEIDEPDKMLEDSTIEILEEIKEDIVEMGKDKYFQSINDAQKEKIKIFEKNFERVQAIHRVDDAELFSDEMVYFYVTYWKASVSGVRRNIARSYIEINRKIDNLPIEIFNEHKLREILDEPFSDSEILINLYKAKMKEKFMKGGREFEAQLQNLKAAMNKLLELNEGRFGEEKTRRELLEQVNNIKKLLGVGDEETIF